MACGLRKRHSPDVKGKPLQISIIIHTMQPMKLRSQARSFELGLEEVWPYYPVPVHDISSASIASC